MRNIVNLLREEPVPWAWKKNVCVVLVAHLLGAAYAPAAKGSEAAEAPSSLQSAVSGQTPARDASLSEEQQAAHGPEPETDLIENTWIDRTHRGLHGFLWRSAMRVDKWFGADMPDEAYEGNTTGSITPVVLWDEFNGFDQKFRFRVKMPLPHLDERYNAFVGTFSRDEFVTGREQESGAIPRQRSGGGVEEDQTLLGIQYRDRKDGGRFEADAGIRIRSPIDPFVKGGYRFQHLTGGDVLLTLRETAFWQNSEGFGLTSRFDAERGFPGDSIVRFSASGTISQESAGVRGYASVTYYRGLSESSAIAGQMFTSGEFDAAVPLGEYGIRASYRKRLFRDWLVLELRPSLTWPKNRPEQIREASWGIGIGFEMFFGEEDFLARPATF